MTTTPTPPSVTKDQDIIDNANQVIGITSTMPDDHDFEMGLMPATRVGNTEIARTSVDAGTIELGETAQLDDYGLDMGIARTRR